jgi:asparagine synthase (glutamine-hydrolysing)
MCGICGIVGFSDGFAVSQDVVTRMRDMLVHRGPDDGGSWCDTSQRVALGHRRLSIVDLSAAGHQPMANEDGTVWITFNGEIYNHRALRADLERDGHIYRSRTDTETILHLYERDGPRCVDRLDGMFAFAIWDARRRQLFLARDRLGVKPLYYAQVAGGFVFGSEIKAILEHPAVRADLDEEAFFHYLTFAFAPAPMTLYRGIRKLAPAERMTVDANGRVESATFWNPLTAAAASAVEGISEVEAAERVRELLRDSIQKRMMSDVPFGVFLSGGLDSSTNVALMSTFMERPVRTFSTAPRGHPQYDEPLRDRPPRGHRRRRRSPGVPAYAVAPPGRADGRLDVRPAALRREARTGHRHNRCAVWRRRGRAVPRI